MEVLWNGEQLPPPEAYSYIEEGRMMNLINTWSGRFRSWIIELRFRRLMNQIQIKMNILRQLL